MLQTDHLTPSLAARLGQPCLEVVVGITEGTAAVMWPPSLAAATTAGEEEGEEEASKIVKKGVLMKALPTYETTKITFRLID